MNQIKISMVNRMDVIYFFIELWSGERCIDRNYFLYFVLHSESDVLRLYRPLVASIIYDSHLHVAEDGRIAMKTESEENNE